MNFPVGRSHRLNFIVDYVNVSEERRGKIKDQLIQILPEENRPIPFELNELVITKESVEID